MTAHIAAQRGVRRAAVRRRLVAGVAFMMLLAFVAVAEAHGLAAYTAASRPPRLSTDDGGTPMFSVSNLTPAQTVSRCVTVFHDGVAYPGELRLTGDASGTLARHLDLAVESGTGGRFGQCDGFVGRARYTGTLQAFAATHGEHTQGLVVPTAAKTATTFRLTVTVLPDAQAAGTSGNGSFIWRVGDAAVTAPVLPPGKPPAPPPPSEAPRSSAPAEPRRPGGVSAEPHAPSVPAPDTAAEAGGPERVADPVETVPAAPREATGVAESDASAVTGRWPAGHVDGGHPAPDADNGILGWRARLSRLLADTAAVIAVVAKSVTFSLLLLLLVTLFLLVQNRIDRNDPKLADAPIGAEPDLEFEPPPTLEGSLR